MTGWKGRLEVYGTLQRPRSGSTGRLPDAANNMAASAASNPIRPFSNSARIGRPLRDRGVLYQSAVSLLHYFPWSPRPAQL